MIEIYFACLAADIGKHIFDVYMWCILWSFVTVTSERNDSSAGIWFRESAAIALWGAYEMPLA
jgi:hypothetical protein